MSIWEKVVEIANKAMETEANQILGELREACPKNTGKTAASFHIMKEGSNARVSVGGKGLLTSVVIGSNEPSAYYADQGSGATDKYIAFTPKGGIDGRRPYGSKDGKVRSMGRKAIPPTYFVKAVADRHR